MYAYLLLLRLVIGMKTQLLMGQGVYRFRVNSPGLT